MSDLDIRWERFLVLQVNARWVGTDEAGSESWQIQTMAFGETPTFVVTGKAILREAGHEITVQLAILSSDLAPEVAAEVDSLKRSRQLAEEVEPLLWERTLTTAMAVAGLAGIGFGPRPAPTPEFKIS
jgi:hypothetical protein